METTARKCVIIMDAELPAGVAANTAAILGVTLGKLVPETVGADVADSAGKLHRGIVTTPVPVLKADAPFLYALRQRLYEAEFADILVVDFSDVAQGCRTYDEYIEKAAGTPPESLRYLGLALCGDKKRVNKLTGSLPLLR